MRIFKQSILENLIYTIVWLIIFLFPIFVYRHSSEMELSIILHNWSLSIPFLILFLVHNYFLFPYLFSQKKYNLYITSCAVFILMIFFYLQQHPHRSPLPHLEPRSEHFPPLEKQNNSDNFRFIPEIKDHHAPPDMPILNKGVMMDVILLILLVTFNIMVKLIFKYVKDQELVKELERYSLQMELENLKNQINPHFFMNTLNNIHALMDIDSERAKETIIDLSKMMRHVLYESNRPHVPIQKEIQFIQNYISLMSIRCSKSLDIRINIPQNTPEIQIPPLLFISYIENAFKHGISNIEQSFIHISLEFSEREIRFFVQNSLHPHPSDEHRGVGLENTRKRLNLLYGHRYSLTTTNINNTYCVILIIPIDYDKMCRY